MIARKPNSLYEHKLGDSTIPDKDRPTFILKNLLTQEHADALDLGHSPGLQMSLLLKIGLKGWSNLKDVNGADVPWPGSAATAADMLPSMTRQALANRIFVGESSGDSSKEKPDILSTNSPATKEEV